LGRPMMWLMARIPSRRRRFLDAQGGEDGVDQGGGGDGVFGQLDAGVGPPPQITATAGAGASALPLFAPLAKVTFHRSGATGGSPAAAAGGVRATLTGSAPSCTSSLPWPSPRLGVLEEIGAGIVRHGGN
jgi:hypothetical protein